MKPLLLSLSHSRYRYSLPIPMLTQMGLLIWMATEGRPSTHIHLPDWLLHISAYTVLTVLAWIACHGAFPSRNILHHRFCAAGISGGFGMLDELLQRTTSLRCSDPIDLAADVAGAVIGFVIIMLYSHFGKETFPS